VAFSSISRSWPADDLARRVRDQIAGEYQPHPLAEWLLFWARTAAAEIAGRLEQAGYLTRAGGWFPWRSGRWVPVDPDWAFAPLLRVRSALDPARPFDPREVALAGPAVASGLGFRLGQYLTPPGRSRVRRGGGDPGPVRHRVRDDDPAHHQRRRVLRSPRPGWGRPAGVAAALVALLAYTFLQVGLHGALGPSAQAQAAAHLGIHAAWWVWALVTILGLARVDITGKVLGVLLTVEVITIAAETSFGLAHPAGGQLSAATLSPSALTSAGFGTVGVLAMVAVLGFVGFEQAPVLAEEARHPWRTITYCALGVDVEATLGRLASLGLRGPPWRVTQPTPRGPVTLATVRDPDGLLVLLTPGSITRNA
jgi:hypothetical protein